MTLPYEVVAALARELRAGAPAVFVLEDVHWAGEATLDALRLLVRRIETVPALIVVSYRDDELARAHPLRIVLGEVASSQAVGRLKLAALSPAAVAQLAEPYGADPGELYRKTSGNPFFVVEALAAGADEIPDTVRDAVFARAARLGARARRLLAAVAAVPPQAELWLLEALAVGPRLGEHDLRDRDGRAGRPCAGRPRRRDDTPRGAEPPRIAPDLTAPAAKTHV